MDRHDRDNAILFTCDNRLSCQIIFCNQKRRIMIMKGSYSGY